MLHRIPVLFRPFGFALGTFIVLNLALALQRPTLAVTSNWLEADLPEPWLSLFGGILGVCLLFPHDLGRVEWVRWLSGGVFAGFSILALASTVAFYVALHGGRVRTDFPVPLSAFVLTILVMELARVIWWKPLAVGIPAPARAFLAAAAVSGAFLSLMVAHIVSFGHRDFRCNADAAVILGAKVYPDGRPYAALRDRLETGVELHRQGLVRYLILTGGTDPAGVSEPLAMRDYVVQRGVPAAQVILDEGGVTTRASARNCARIARREGFRNVLAVTQYFHCARVKMVFEREGLPCATVPTCSSAAADRAGSSLSREGYFLLREAVALPFYLIYHR